MSRSVARESWHNPPRLKYVDPDKSTVSLKPHLPSRALHGVHGGDVIGWELFLRALNKGSEYFEFHHI